MGPSIITNILSALSRVKSHLDSLVEFLRSHAVREPLHRECNRLCAHIDDARLAVQFGTDDEIVPALLRVLMSGRLLQRRLALATHESLHIRSIGFHLALVSVNVLMAEFERRAIGTIPTNPSAADASSVQDQSEVLSGV